MKSKGVFRFFFLFLITCSSLQAQLQPDSLKTGEEKAFIFHTKKLPDSIIQELKKDPDYWYADLTPAERKEKKPTQSTWLDSKIFKSLIWILVIMIFFIILLLYIRVSSFRLFTNTGKSLQQDDFDVREENIFSLDYSKNIQQAVAHGDYRSAVRLLFLQTLKQMHEQGIIRYAPEATNAEYVRQIQAKPQYAGFHELSTVFDYAWYGNFPVGQEKFEHIQKRFLAFQNRINP